MSVVEKFKASNDDGKENMENTVNRTTLITRHNASLKRVLLRGGFSFSEKTKYQKKSNKTMEQTKNNKRHFVKKRRDRGGERDEEREKERERE